MNTIKKLKFKLFASIGITVLIAIIGIGLGVRAYTNESSNQPTTVIENAGGVTINNPIPVIPEPETFGAMTSPISEYDYSCINGDCTFHLVQTFINASTTIASIPNPFTKATSTGGGEVQIDGQNPGGYAFATSTVEMVRLTITGASTSTAEDISCGASATAYAAASYKILDSDLTPTSTVGVIENGIATAYNAGIGGGAIQKIMLTPTYPYLVCTVTAALDGGFIGDNNTFDGKITARISRQRL